MEKVEEKIDKMEQKPHLSFDKQQPQPQPQQTPPPYIPSKNYLITISDVETQVSLGVKAPNIMIALRKFTDKYANDFNDLILLSLDIQEIEVIE